MINFLLTLGAREKGLHASWENLVMLRDKLNIGRIGWASRGPYRLGPIGEAEAEYRDADRAKEGWFGAETRRPLGKIFRREYILGVSVDAL